MKVNTDGLVKENVRPFACGGAFWGKLGYFFGFRPDVRALLFFVSCFSLVIYGGILVLELVKSRSWSNI